MESLSLSHSVVNNLNQAFDEHTKINRHLQTGKRVMHARDDVGEASKLGKTKMDLIKNRKIQENLQNSLSLLQAQDGMFKVIGDILDRSSELKIRFDSPVANSAEKEAYNKEFTELQGELRSIAQSKWNGISLFSTQNSRTLFPMQILPLHPMLAAEIRDFNLDQFGESDWTRIIESLKKYSVLFSGTRK